MSDLDDAIERAYGSHSLRGATSIFAKRNK